MCLIRRKSNESCGLGLHKQKSGICNSHKKTLPSTTVKRFTRLRTSSHGVTERIVGYSLLSIA